VFSLGAVLTPAEVAADARADEVARSLRRALAVANRYVDTLTVVCERIVRVALKARVDRTPRNQFFPLNGSVEASFDTVLFACEQKRPKQPSMLC
jgi:hypothetical protein